jgi:hypothetical protein
MSSSGFICAICAWRATCQKKFSVSGKDLRCAEFVKDLTIKDSSEEESGNDKESNDKKKKN